MNESTRSSVYRQMEMIESAINIDVSADVPVVEVSNVILKLVIINTTKPMDINTVRTTRAFIQHLDRRDPDGCLATNNGQYSISTSSHLNCFVFFVSSSSSKLYRKSTISTSRLRLVGVDRVVTASVCTDVDDILSLSKQTVQRGFVTLFVL